MGQTVVKEHHDKKGNEGSKTTPCEDYAHAEQNQGYILGMANFAIESCCNQACLSELGCVDLSCSEQEQGKTQQHEDNSQWKHGVDREYEMGKPCRVRISIEPLDVKHRAIKKPGKRQKHPDDFYQDEQNREL